MTLIANQDFVSLSTYVHPSQGVRFSPYAYVDVENHLKFNAQDVADLLLDTTMHTWGAYDGSGFPIELSFADYYTRFV
ncbi:MAG: sporulation protein [Bacillota bacterium]|nr:MAG: sporulation protein [Bacillota bacterium]